ncbi:MAG: hypothetical protein K9J06_10395 [Flavobacteriales bacterium]|nr:hypothetical protein [Flavobacteriales bacterium]
MKSSPFKLFTAAAFACMVAVMPSCSDKEGCMDPNAANFDPDATNDNGSCSYDAAVVTGELTADQTWTNDRIWVISGRVIVPNGITLTIEAGTIVKAETGQEANASALIVSRGGVINAVGTADAPIIFTSILDNIQLGEKVGTNLTRTENEKWGGVAILGHAPISAQAGDVESNLEGIPAGTGVGLYGGSNAADNSGILKYVSIRHGGISIGEGNELNGLTLGGVGSGTVIENIEIYATLDDGIECFGGTVNISNALVYYQGDDGLDLDQNYSGTIENFIVIHGDGIATDKGLEVDGTEGSTHTTGRFTLSNGLVKSEGQDGAATDFKDKAQGTIENVTFDYSAKGGSVNKVRAKYDATTCAPGTDSFTRLMADLLVFTNIKSIGTCPIDVYTSSTACTAEEAADQVLAETKYNTNGTGSTVSTSIFSWTAASARGQL